MSMTFRTLAAMAAVIALVACGGGGGGKPATMTPPPQQQPPQTVADTDGDGVADAEDAFPNDPSETADSDGDGVGDNADAFPRDASETMDSDGDGVGNNRDAFPNDPAETADSDGDGVGDNADAFPQDASETADTDGDGVGDNRDAFPNDSTRTALPDFLPFPLRASSPGAASWASSGTTCLAGSGCRFHNFQWSAHAPHYGTADLPVPDTADAAHMPIYHDHRSGSRKRLFVGADQGSIGGLPRTGDYDGVEIRYGTLADGAGRQTVSTYLAQAAQVPVRWSAAPVVTYSGHATDEDFARLVRAVQLVNTALPDDRKMRIGSSSPTRNPENGIHVEFVLERDFSYPGAWGNATTTWQGNTITHASIVINEAYAVAPRDRTSSLGPAFDPPEWGFEQVNRQGTIVLAHELLHALGITSRGSGHVSGNIDSIMKAGDIYEPGASQPLSLLYEADREALRALYGAFEDGDTLADFGPWANTALHIHGNGPHAGFGVALRNGYAEPWAYGAARQSA